MLAGGGEMRARLTTITPMFPSIDVERALRSLTKTSSHVRQQKIAHVKAH